MRASTCSIALAGLFLAVSLANADPLGPTAPGEVASSEPWAAAELQALVQHPSTQDRASQLLGGLGSGLTGGDRRLEEVVGLQLPPALHPDAGRALTRLAVADPAAARTAGELSRRGDWGSGGILLRTGPFLPDPVQDTVAKAVVRALHGTDPTVWAAALDAARQMKLKETGARVRHLAQRAPQPTVRRAAVRAMSGTCAADAATIDLLLELLDDPELARTAHGTLMHLTGARLPLRKEMWQAWRQRQRLPGDPPAPPAQPLSQSDGWPLSTAHGATPSSVAGPGALLLLILTVSAALVGLLRRPDTPSSKDRLRPVRRGYLPGGSVERWAGSFQEKELVRWAATFIHDPAL